MGRNSIAYRGMAKVAWQAGTPPAGVLRWRQVFSGDERSLRDPRPVPTHRGCPAGSPSPRIRARGHHRRGIRRSGGHHQARQQRREPELRVRPQARRRDARPARRSARRPRPGNRRRNRLQRRPPGAPDRPGSQVTTLDIDTEITAQARQALEATGYRQVSVITRDGALGAAEHAPYDRIIRDGRRLGHPACLARAAGTRRAAGGAAALAGPDPQHRLHAPERLAAIGLGGTVRVRSHDRPGRRTRRTHRPGRARCPALGRRPAHRSGLPGRHPGPGEDGYLVPASRSALANPSTAYGCA